MSGPLVNSPAVPRIPLFKPDTKELETTAATLLGLVTGVFEVTNNDEYAAAGKLVVELKGYERQVDEQITAKFKKHIDNATKTLADLRDDRKDDIAALQLPSQNARLMLTEMMDAHAKRVEAERKKALEDAAAQAKKEREEREAKDKKDKEEAIQKAKDEQAKKAEELKAQGKDTEAAAVLAAPVVPEPVRNVYVPASLPMFNAVAMPAAPPKVAGMSKRTNVVWEVDVGEPPENAPSTWRHDQERAALLLLVREASKNPDAWLDCLTYDEATIKAKAKASGEAARVPGLKFVDKPIDTITTGRKTK